MNFRSGTYCTQVLATDVNKSLIKWLLKIQQEKDEIKYLGDKIIEDLKKEIEDEFNKPIELNNLKNIWYTRLQSKAGCFEINIIKTKD